MHQIFALVWERPGAKSAIAWFFKAIEDDGLAFEKERIVVSGGLKTPGEIISQS